MSLSLRDIVDRIEQRIQVDPLWHLSAHSYHDFPPHLDTTDVIHRSYAVGLLATVTLEDRQTRGARHVGAWVETTVSVRFLHDVRADDKRGSHHEALDAEQELVALVLATHPDPELTLLFEGTVTRDLIAPEVYLCEVQFLAHHHYALQ